MKAFYILIHDFNYDRPKKHNIMPYLVNTYQMCKTKNLWWPFKDTSKAPHTIEDFKYFVTAVCKQQYWSRCQYEWLMLGWPYGRTDTLENCKKVIDSAVKVDGYAQIEMNIDVVTDIFMQNINCK